MRHWPFIGLLAILAAGVVPAGLQSAPWLFVAGVALAAGAPLAYITRHTLRQTAAPLRYHPLAVSIVSGTGCIMTVAGQYRYDRFDWVVWCALAALVAWMAWQRWVRARSGEPAPNPENRPQETRR